MTNTKNKVPVYVEERIISQAQVALNKQKVIPHDFVELTSYGESSSTAGFPKIPCWRYNFSYNNSKEWIILDIAQELMEKLGLESGKKFSDLVFISPEVLKREPECAGVTLKDEKEILLAPSGSKLVRESGVQTKLSSKEIKELEKKLEELEIKSTDLDKLKNIWRNKYLEEKESNGQEFQIQINELIRERDSIQRKLNNQQIEIDNLQNEIKRLNNNLQTTQKDKDKIKNDLQVQLKQSQNRQKDLQNQINQLNAQINGLNQQLTNLTNERDDYQTKWDTSTEELEHKEEIIRGYLRRIEQLDREKEQRDNEIVRLRNSITRVEEERDKRPGDVTLAQWRNDFSKRPTRQQFNSIQQQLNNVQHERNNLQTQLNNIRTELSNTRNERDDYQRRWNNHTSSYNRVYEHECFPYCDSCKD